MNTNIRDTFVDAPAERIAGEDDAARAAEMPAAREGSRTEIPQVKDSRASIPLGTDNPNTRVRTDDHRVATDDERLAPLFAQDVARDFRARWVVVQQGFVDDPRKAVEEGDELVRQVMSNLAETFSKEGAALRTRFDESGKASTETLRVALRSHRSLFERLLSF